MSAIIKHTSLPKRKRHLPIAAYVKLIIGLFLLGALAGCLCENLLKAYLYEPVLTLFQNTINNLPSLEISSKEIFFYSLKESLKLFLLLCFFALTNAWRLYSISFTLYTGFTHGLLLSFCLLVNKLNGILQYLCFLLPHTLLLIPVFLLAISHLEILHSDLFAPENNDGSHGIFGNTKKRQLLFTKLPLFFLCITLLIIGALLEGYLNVPLLKYFHAKI